jgi:hypothetical protein
MYSETRFRKSTLRNAVLLALSINGAAMILGDGTAQADNQACANAVSTDSANFTMLTAGGYVVGGTNNAAMSWDGTAFTASSDYAGPGSTSNVTMASTTPFFGTTVSYTWTAHDIQVFAPGSYSFDTALGGGNGESGTMNVTVPAGKLGIHMLFNWNGNDNIDVFVVAEPGSVFGAGIGYTTQTTISGLFRCGTGAAGTQELTNCLYDGKDFGSAGKPLGNKTWMLASVDGDGNSVMGIPMASGGPFGGFNANFNFSFSSALTLTSGTVCNPSDDTQPDAFDFPDVTGAASGSENTSDPITVSGLNDLDGGGVSAPISIAGGTYSINSGAYTNAAGTVTNGDTVRVRQTAASTEDGTRTDTILNIGGVPGTYSVTVVDKKPGAFSFTDQTGVATSTPVESDTITVSGMDTGLTTPINITGGEYSKNGGAYTSAAGTVTNGDTIKVQLTSSANPATTVIATLTLGASANSTTVSDDFSVRTAGGVNTSNNNFTMIDPSGGVVGGTNDVAMSWDQQLNTDESDPVTPATAHMFLSSSEPFFQFNWVAHHIRVFGPGTYTIDTTCTTAQLEAGTAVCNNLPLPSGQTQQFYTFTVGANQIGAHMLFDWGKDAATPCGKASCNIDVVDIWDQSATFGPSPMHTGSANCNNPATVWSLMSSDWDGDGQNGAAMIDGPFKGFKANFNVLTSGTPLACSAYTPTVNVDDPSASTGCSISTKPVNALERGDWWLVAGFLAWLGALRMRFKRQTQS